MSSDLKRTQLWAVQNASNTIINYLLTHSDLLWSLLYYTDKDDNPHTKPILTQEQRVSMICNNYYDTSAYTEKQVLFITESDEAFVTAVPQLRIEVADITPLDEHRSCITITMQVIVPNRQDVLTSTDITGERRSDDIYLELDRTLRNVYIEDSGFNSPLIFNRNAPKGVGRGTGSYRQKLNKDFTGRWITFSVLI